jgi:hypothetical protein
MDWNYGSLTYKEESLMLNTTGFSMAMRGN